MSTRVMAACWPLQMPPTPKAVLVSLADNANDHGECWPSITHICERTCLGKTAVINAIKWLEDSGLLQADRSNGRHSRYAIDLQRIGQADMFGAKPVRETDRSAKQTGPANDLDQSARRTAPVREADTNRKEPTTTTTATAKQKQPSPSAVALPAAPEWLDGEAWIGFVDMRKRLRFPLTPRAADLIFKSLASFRAQGMNPNDVLDQSTRNGWRDVFALKNTTGNGNGTTGKLSASEQTRAAINARRRAESADVGR